MITLLVTVGGVYAVLCLGLYLGQQRLIYFPDRQLVASPAAVGLEYSDLWLQAEDGVRLHAWWVPGPAQGPVVLFLHGNAGNISHRLETLNLLAGLGAGVLMLEYRGYGQSEGKPDEQGNYRDAVAAHDHLTGTLAVPAERIVVFGRSLGGGVATGLAAERPCGALVVESTFTSVPDLAAELYPIFPVRLLTHQRYDSRARIARAGCPVLVVHSRDDEIVPFRHGEQLFDAAAQPKRLLTISGGHNDGFLVSGERYREGLRALLDEVRTP